MATIPSDIAVNILNYSSKNIHHSFYAFFPVHGCPLTLNTLDHINECVECNVI